MGTTASVENGGARRALSLQPCIGQMGEEYRSLMMPRRLQRNGYTQRWKIESFVSGLNRTTGSML